jgi:hypothetical protein
VLTWNLRLVKWDQNEQWLPYLGLWVIAFVVWRVLAARALVERLGEAFIPGLLIVLSCASMWVLLTVFAVALAQRPQGPPNSAEGDRRLSGERRSPGARRRTGGCEDGSHGFREPVDLNLFHRQDVLIGRSRLLAVVGCRSIPWRSGRLAGVLAEVRGLGSSRRPRARANTAGWINRRRERSVDARDQPTPDRCVVSDPAVTGTVYAAARRRTGLRGLGREITRAAARCAPQGQPWRASGMSTARWRRGADSDGTFRAER